MPSCKPAKGRGLSLSPMPSDVSEGPGVSQDADASPRPNKLHIIVLMLHWRGGATMPELVAATGWKQSSIRGAISGAIRKRRLMNVISVVDTGVRSYRIEG
jgi:hypothetical protein